MSDRDTWKRVPLVRDISPQTQTLQVILDGEAVCLYKLGDKICATQDRCTHGNASLAQGYVEEGTIECPLHQGVFDIATGKAKGPPVTIDLICYEVMLEEGVVYLRSTHS